jgi:hypothetical protein
MHDRFTAAGLSFTALVSCAIGLARSLDPPAPVFPECVEACERRHAQDCDVGETEYCVPHAPLSWSCACVSRTKLGPKK